MSERKPTGPKSRPKSGALLPGLGGGGLKSAFGKEAIMRDRVRQHNAPDHMTLVGIQQQLEVAMGHHRKGQLDIAGGIYQDILAKFPNQPDALNLLGVIRVAQSNARDGIRLISLAVQFRPNDPTVLNNLGNAYLSERQWLDSIEYLERAVALKPDFLEALSNLGRAYRHSDQSDESEYCYRKMLERSPNNVMALIGMSRIYQDRGMAEESEELIQKVLKFRGGRLQAYSLFAHTRKFKERPSELDEIEKMIAKLKDGQEKCQLHYAAGKMYDDLKEYDDAFKHYKAGNDLTQIEHSHDAFVRLVDRTISVCDKKFFEERKGWGVESDRPIFIVGMPRSGTTLREQIIGSHPDAFGAGELEHIKRIQMKIGTLVPEPKPFPENLELLTKEGSVIAGRWYLRALERHSSTAKHVTDKMPHNFLSLGMMAVIFQNAKFIHSKRNPMDTSLSCFMHNFNDAHTYNRDLTNMGLYYRQYVRLMEHFHEVLGDRLYFSSYDDLVADPETEIPKMIEFCGLEWNDACLKFYESKRAVMTPSQWQVRQPIYTRSSDRWKRYEKQLQPLLEALGDLAPE